MKQETEKTSFEREMAKKNATVVMFKNIDKEDFTHPYDGIPWTVRAREVLPLQYPIAMHLAKHLALRMLRRQKIEKGIVGDKDRLGKPINLYPVAEVEKLMDQMILESIEQPAERVKTPGELEKEKTAELSEKFGPRAKKLGKPATDKKEVIAELKRRGVKHDPRAPIGKLLEKLVESEKEG